MKQAIRVLTLCAVLGLAALVSGAQGVERERLGMDFDWKFSLGHAADMAKDFDFGGGDPAGNAKTGDIAGPPHPRFDDSAWEVIDVPHDWVVALEYDKSAEQYHGYKQIGRAWPENCIGWYRKTFEIPESDLGKRITLEFDGIFRDSQVWLNGHPVWHHQSGYTSFGFDVSDYIKYGERNVLVVRADASEYELWSYEGAGIYRHVWMVKTDPLHVARWGTYVQSDVTLDGDGASAALAIKTTLQNEQDEDATLELTSTVQDGARGPVILTTTSTHTLAAWDRQEIIQNANITNGKLWSLESPHLYTMQTTVKQDGNVVDRYRTTFGLRTIRFDADEGFFLNGKAIKLKGVCNHQDHGGVGVALPDRVQEFRIAKLREMGCNSIRTAHNWVAAEMLDAADRLGMLIMDETRMSGSSEELLNQLDTMIRRDRNHPSIIIWSLGNEEHRIQGNETGARIFRTMKRLVRKLDPTRPVILGMNGAWGSVVTAEMDIHGSNYLKTGDMPALRKKFPRKPVMLSESSSSLTTRGIYAAADGSGYCSDYDETFPPWGDTVQKMWNYVDERPWMAGTYIWTGFDYGGEPLPDFWPAVNSNFGILDRAGFPKDNFYYLKSWWTDEVVLHLSPHWNWAGQEGKNKRVVCNTNCQEVELLVNGQSMGRKTVERNGRVTWNVEYQPGAIEARGFNFGNRVATDKHETTGKPTGIRLKPDRTTINADNQDVSLFTLEVVDAQGRVVPTAGNDITLNLTHNGRIIGVCNGDPSCKVLESKQTYPVFNGLMMVFVQSSRDAGPITLKAQGKDLKKAETTIEARRARPKPFVESLTRAKPMFQPGNFAHTLGPSPAMTPEKKGTDWDDRALESGDCFKDGDTDQAKTQLTKTLTTSGKNTILENSDNHHLGNSPPTRFNLSQPECRPSA